MSNPNMQTSGETNHEQLAAGLAEVIDQTHPSNNPNVAQTIHIPAHKVASHPWLHKYLPTLQHWESAHHVGNYVVIRGTKEQIFEYMPIYARIGMHLLFYGKAQIELLGSKTVEDHLREQSIKEGKIYDLPDSVNSIPSFISTYDIDIAELLYPDLASYKTFNEFFYRKLTPNARPVQNIDDSAGFCSAADCRLTVFGTVEKAKDLWIKGNNFNLANLLGSQNLASDFAGGSLAVFRLAPADYHRFHSPADAIVGEVINYPGQYYTVNPQAVNEPGFDVFTANKRSVLLMKHTSTGQLIAFVAIGALLVASVNFTVQEGQSVRRGEELGYFAYGGSTVIVVFPKGMIKFDDDLEINSNSKIETLMKVGYSLGVSP